MGFGDYLEFVRIEDADNEYPRIVVNGSAASQTAIEYLELRPDGDYFRIANRNFPLRSLASGAGFERVNFVYDLTKIPGQIVRGARFSVLISMQFGEVHKMEDVVLDPEHILAFGRLEDRLARHHSGIIRSNGGISTN